MTKSICIFLYLAFITFSVFGQISFGGIPSSFTVVRKSATVVPVIDMTPVDNAQLLVEEHLNPKHFKSYLFAKSIPVDISPDHFGLWEVRDEMNIWRLGIRSKGAWSLNLIFDQMIIPQGASLFIYSSDKEKVLGAFTSQNEQTSGYFSTFPIAGDEIVVEYNEPSSTTFKGQIHISAVNHDYKNIFGTRPLGEAGLCNMDVACPEAENYSVLKQSVVDLLVGGRELCSGTLVNNTRQDKTPYLITAGHCIESGADAQTTVFCFNYESPFCGDGESSLNGSADQTMSGSVLKARSDSLDFALVQLESDPPSTFRPYFAGWNRLASVPASTVAIHHPQGDVKKICKDDNPPTIGSYDDDFISNAFWVIGNWEVGTTETGSSGCGLFNQNQLLVGSLTGGTATCTDPTNDLFSMFSKQWDFYSATNHQLKIWLDPTNTGSTSLPGLKPYDGVDSCSLFNNTVLGEKYTLQSLGGTNGGYLSGQNRLKVTQYAERFGKTDQTTLSSVSIGVAKLKSSVYNQNSKITLKVYDENKTTSLPGNELLSMDVPFSLLSENKMNYIDAGTPLVIEKKYFIGFEINYSNSTDTFAVYHTPDRQITTENEAFAMIDGHWKPFYSISDLGISTSLLIQANGCQNTLATSDQSGSGEGEKFEVLYPQSSASNYILLQNNGSEDFGEITLYDILGRKIYSEESLLTSTPKQINLAHYHSGLYFLSIETMNARQVIKIRVNYIK